MPYYRLYFMNPSSGHIDRSENLVARDNFEAIETAGGFRGRQPMELWCEGHKVQRFEARDEIFDRTLLSRRAAGPLSRRASSS